MVFGNEDQGLVLFETSPVRRIWHDGRWFYSVIDVVAVLTGSENPRQYWYDMKRRVKDEGFLQVSAKCLQFKLRAPDGRMRESDCGDVETILRIIQSIPSPNAEPFRQWLAGLGADALEGRTEDQKRIENRGQGIEVKKQLHGEVHARGVQSRRAHAELEARGHTKLYGGETLADSKERKGLDASDDLGEWMSSEELADNSFRDAQSRAYIRRMNIQGKEPVMQAHEQISEKVREFIIEELEGTPPEALPTPSKSLAQARKDEERRLTRGLDLFPPAVIDQALTPERRAPQQAKDDHESH